VQAQICPEEQSELKEHSAGPLYWLVLVAFTEKPKHKISTANKNKILVFISIMYFANYIII
jgi:hypothetical protein